MIDSRRVLAVAVLVVGLVGLVVGGVVVDPGAGPSERGHGDGPELSSEPVGVDGSARDGARAPASPTANDDARSAGAWGDGEATAPQRGHRGAAGTSNHRAEPAGGALASDDASAATEQIRHGQTLSLTPDRPGSYDARSRYRVPDPVTSLEVSLPAEATLLDTEGFEVRSADRLAWDGTTAEPSFRIRMPANRTVDRDDPIAGPGNYLYVDVGEWALVQRPPLGHSWGWQGAARVGLESSLDAEPGVAGDVVAYLGEYEEHTREAHDQRFRLIEPASANMTESPEAVLDEFANASDALRVGERDDEVFAVAAPTDGVEWGVRGLQTGPADVWVRDAEPLDDVDSVWLHEYVHTRQDWRTAPDAAWITEATATYYAALLSLESERIGFQEFRDRLATGELEEPFEGVVLSDRATWRNHPDYFVGALTAAYLDRQIRISSNGERSLQDALRAMNGASSEVTGDDLRSYLKAAGGSATASRYDAYATSTDRPRMWSADEHQDVFGTLPARIGYRLADGDALRVDGEYREGPIGPGAVLVPGERVSADVVAQNAGGTAGDFEATLRLDDRVLDAREGRLGPGNSTTVTLAGEVEEPGTYDLRVGDRRIPIEVREPATASVTDLSVDESAVGPGQEVQVTADVVNERDWPAEREVVLLVEGEEADSQTVRLDANESTVTESTVSFEEPGEYELSVRGSSANATVVVDRDEDVETRSTNAVVALVGAAIVVLLAVVVVGLLAASALGRGGGGGD